MSSSKLCFSILLGIFCASFPESVVQAQFDIAAQERASLEGLSKIRIAVNLDVDEAGQLAFLHTKRQIQRAFQQLLTEEGAIGDDGLEVVDANQQVQLDVAELQLYVRIRTVQLGQQYLLRVESAIIQKVSIVRVINVLPLPSVAIAPEAVTWRRTNVSALAQSQFDSVVRGAVRRQVASLVEDWRSANGKPPL